MSSRPTGSVTIDNTGRVVLVSGGAQGIGRAICEAFANSGASVVCLDVDAAAAAMLPKGITFIQGDTSSETDCENAVAVSVKKYGALDVLVNLAGIRAYEPLAEARAETWDALIKVNLLSYAYLIRESLGSLRACGRGSIINVASTHAVNPRAGMGQYDVTKAGIISLTKTLAFEEAKHGIRVNAVCPGATLTPFHLRRAKSAGQTREDLDRAGATMCLLGRWADAREVVWPILWLASDEASFITGSVLMVDGGQFTK